MIFPVVHIGAIAVSFLFVVMITVSKITIFGFILAQLSCVRYVGNSSLERSGEPQPSKQAYKHEVKMK